MKFDIEMIERVLDNKATPEEAKLVAKWFAEEEGQEFLSQYMACDRNGLSEEKAMSWLDHDVPEKHMRIRFLNQIRLSRKKGWRRKFMMVAVAVPFLFLGISVTFLAKRAGIFTGTEYVEVSVPFGERMQVILQDGTVVLLNSGTQLRYPRKFGLFNRTVQLSGEGYFDVAKMKGAPFVIDLKGVDVEVTGTRFNVKSYDDDEQKIWVALEEGGIRLEKDGDLVYSLVPGDKVEYDRMSGKCRVDRVNDFEEVVGWKKHRLNFYMTPLPDILKVLERQYDVHFVVKDSLAQESKFTLSTAQADVVDVLKDLETVSHVTFTEKGKNMYEVTIKRE